LLQQFTNTGIKPAFIGDMELIEFREGSQSPVDFLGRTCGKCPLNKIAGALANQLPHQYRF